MDDSIDVSPERNGRVLKRIERRGDASKRRPMPGDTVYIGWKIYSPEGALLHSTPPSPGDDFGSSSSSSDFSDGEMVASDPPPAEPRIVSEEELGPEEFNFELGATPREVIRGWEAAVATMYEGEVAMLTIHPEFAFGEAGAPLGLAPDGHISTRLEVKRVVPSPLRRFETVGPNERCVAGEKMPRNFILYFERQNS